MLSQDPPAAGPPAAGTDRRRRAGLCFAAVAAVSLYALFWPHPAGPSGPDGSDKVVHLLLFGLLAATTRWRFGAAPRLLAAVLAYAASSEVVQGVFLPSRSGDVRDLVADALGAALGWLLAGRYLRRRVSARA